MKKATLIALMVLMSIASAKIINVSPPIALSLTDETRETICKGSGGSWTYGYGCACPKEWVWEDAFGCKPFGANPQLMCTNTNGRWTYYQDEGVNVCICPGAAAGMRFSPETGCSAYTEKEVGVAEQFTGPTITDSINNLTNYLMKDAAKNPIKYFIYMIYGLAILIAIRVGSMLINFLFPNQGQKVVVVRD